MNISIDTTADVPLYRQIVEQVKRLITERQLSPGEQIPAVREMARWLKVNPSTVARAYFDLKQEGVVVTSRRRGTIIIGDGRNLTVAPLNRDRFPEIVGDLASEDSVQPTLSLHLAYWHVQRSA